MKILFIYKDGTAKFRKEKQVTRELLSDFNLRMIGVPFLDKDNSYIPIRPSVLYNFHYAEVYTVFHSASFFPSENLGEHLSEFKYPEERHYRCYDIVSFINVVYNIYKMIAMTITYLDDIDLGYDNQGPIWVIYPLKYSVTFYNAMQEKIDEILSGDLPDLLELMNEFDNWDESPDGIAVDMYVSPLYDILFDIGERFCCAHKLCISYDKIELPEMLEIRDDGRWRDCGNKPTIKDTIMILKKIFIFNIFYLLESELYYSLSQAFTKPIAVYTTTHYCYNPHKIDMYEIPQYFRSTGRMTDIEKIQYLEDMGNGTIQPDLAFNTILNNQHDYINFYVIFTTFIEYIKYFTYMIWGLDDGDKNRIHLLTTASESGKSYLCNEKTTLTQNELTADAFSEMILHVLLNEEE